MNSSSEDGFRKTATTIRNTNKTFAKREFKSEIHDQNPPTSATTVIIHHELELTPPKQKKRTTILMIMRQIPHPLWNKIKHKMSRNVKTTIISIMMLMMMRIQTNSNMKTIIQERTN